MKVKTLAMLTLALVTFWGTLLSVAAFLAAPALAQTVSISARPTNLTLKVGHTAWIHVDAQGSWPGLSGGTCGSYPRAKPEDTLAVTNTQQTKLTNGGSISLDVKAQNPGACWMRFKVTLYDRDGKMHEAVATAHITVTP